MVSRVDGGVGRFGPDVLDSWQFSALRKEDGQAIHEYEKKGRSGRGL